MKDICRIVDTAVYGELTIDYLVVEDKYGFRVHFEDSDISRIITDESCDEAYQKTINYLERLRHALDTWRWQV